MRRGSAARFHGARVAWLEAHPDLVTGVPALTDDVTDANRPALAALERAMQAAGLFGQTSHAASRRETIRRLVGDLRRGHGVDGQW